MNCEIFLLLHFCSLQYICILIITYLDENVVKDHTNLESELTLPINTGKCILLSTNYHLASDRLPQKVLHHDLEVLISSDLSWSHHYDHIFVPTHTNP